MVHASDQPLSEENNGPQQHAEKPEQPPPYDLESWIHASNLDQPTSGLDTTEVIRPTFVLGGLSGVFGLIGASMCALLSVVSIVFLECFRGAFFWLFSSCHSIRTKCLSPRFRCVGVGVTDPCGACISVFGPAMWLTAFQLPFHAAYYLVWGAELFLGAALACSAAFVVLVMSLSWDQARWVFAQMMRVNIAVSTCSRSVCCTEDSSASIEDTPAVGPEDMTPDDALRSVLVEGDQGERDCEKQLDATKA